MVGLSYIPVAIKYFDIDGNNIFYSYWKEIALKEMRKFISKNSYYGEARAFHTFVYEEDDDEQSLEEIVTSPNMTLSEYVSLNDTSFLISEKARELNEHDRKILYLLLIGYKPNEIRSSLNEDDSIIYRSIRRIRTKFKSLIDNDKKNVNK